MNKDCEHLVLLNDKHGREFACFGYDIFQKAISYDELTEDERKRCEITIQTGIKKMR